MVFRSPLVHAFDTAYPPDIPPPGFDAVFGYLGGNTPHIWTLEEWRRFAHLRQCGIWTGYHENNPEGMAVEACNAAAALGWKRGAIFRRAIVNDFETEIDPAWVNAFANTVKQNGYITVTYGSLSFITANPRKGGYFWGAAYNGQQRLYGKQFVAEQYAGNVPFRNTQIDLSVVRRSFLRHLGRGPRHH